MESLKVFRTGEVEIVSSGYDDRYATGRIHLVIEKKGIRYRIENTADWVPAYLELAGLNPSREQAVEAARITHRAPLKMDARYRAGNVSGAVQTTVGRINTGIRVATGAIKDMGEYMAQKDMRIAETLTPEEWLVVKTGLEAINDRHSAEGRSIVNFEIPGWELTRQKQEVRK